MKLFWKGSISDFGLRNDSNADCGLWNDSNADCGMGNAEFWMERMRIDNSEIRNPKSEMG